MTARVVRRPESLLALLTVPSLLGLALPVAADWPMFRHDPARSGRAEGPAPDLSGIEWSVDLGGPVDSSPAVAQGLVLAGTAAGAFHALDAATGAPRWTTSIGQAVVSSPCVTLTRVAFGCVDGYVYALDLATGHEAWRARTGRSVVAPPLAIGDRVIVGSTDGCLYALSAADGAVAWRTERGGEIHGGAAVAGDLAVYADWDGRVHCVRLQDGTPAWSQPYDADGPIVAAPVVEGPYAICAVLAPTALQPPPALNVVCLDLATGRPVWGTSRQNPWATDREQGSMSVSTCPIVVGDALWFVTGEGYANWSAVVRSAALASGARLAAIPRNALGQAWAVTDSSPSLAQGQLFFADYSGLLNQVDTTTARPVRALALGAKTCSSPAISDGRLYLGLTNGRLLCIR